MTAPSKPRVLGPLRPPVVPGQHGPDPLPVAFETAGVVWLPEDADPMALPIGYALAVEFLQVGAT